MTEGGAYRVEWSGPARRAINERLPLSVASAAAELITGPIAGNPYRLGKPLRDELAGIYSARIGREWRVLYEVDERGHTVRMLDIRHWSVAYRRR